MLKREVGDVCLACAVSQRVAVHELLAPLGERAASKERVILEQLRDQLLDVTALKCSVVAGLRNKPAT